MAYYPKPGKVVSKSPTSKKESVVPLFERPVVAVGYFITGLCNLVGIRTEAQKRIDADLATHQSEMKRLDALAEESRRTERATDALLAGTLPFGKKSMMTDEASTNIEGAPEHRHR